MALLFAENGITVSLSDPAEQAMDSVIEKAEKARYHNRVKKYTGIRPPLALPRVLTACQTTSLCANHYQNPGL